MKYICEMRNEEMGCIDTDKGNGNNKALNNFYILKIYTFLKLRKMQRKLGFLKSLFLGLNSNNPNVINVFYGTLQYNYIYYYHIISARLDWFSSH